MAQRIFRIDKNSPVLNASILIETSQDDRYIACLSSRDVFIIRSYLFPYAQWRTRLARPVYGNYWQLATEAEYTQLLDDLEALDAKLTEDKMSCIDNGLTKIAEALTLMAQKMCCGDAPADGGVVGIAGENGEIPIYGSGPLLEITEGVPPEGFETWGDYLANKCQVANGIFDGALSALSILSTITFTSVTSLAVILGLALAPILPFPPVAIPVMIGLLVGLAGFYAAFGLIKDELENNRESIVCDLYNSNTVETMTSVFADALDAAIAQIGVPSTVGVLLKSAALLLVNGNTLNQLQSGIAGYVVYSDADCTSCEQDQVIHQQTDYPQSWENMASFEYEYGVQYELSSYNFASGTELQEFAYVAVDFGQLVDVEFDVAFWSAPGEGWGESNYFRAGTSYGQDFGGENNLYSENNSPAALSGVGNITFASAPGGGFLVGVTITAHV